VDPEGTPRLADLLGFVAARSRYHAASGADPARLNSFPVMSKLEVRSHLPELLTLEDPLARERLAAELLRASLPGEQNRAGELRFGDGVVIDQTTGTSGIPARFPKTNPERAELALAGFMQRRRIDPALRVGEFVPLLHHRWDQRFDFDIWSRDTAEIRRLYAWLAGRKARWIHIPSILIARHARALEEAGVSDPVPGLRFLEATGSRLTPEAVEAATRVFKAGVVNQYGTIEMWAIAYAEGAGPFTVNSDAVHVEVVDAQGRAIGEPGVEGDIVVTNLVLRLLPLVRYRTGDRGSWVEGGRRAPAGPRGRARRQPPLRRRAEDLGHRGVPAHPAPGLQPGGLLRGERGPDRAGRRRAPALHPQPLGSRAGDMRRLPRGVPQAPAGPAGGLRPSRGGRRVLRRPQGQPLRQPLGASRTAGGGGRPVNPFAHLAAHARILASRLDRTGVDPAAEPVRLPFNESPTLATYLHLAFFFGILTPDGPNDGLLNIFIQLCAPRERPDRLDVLPLRFLPTIPADRLGLLESADWTAGEIGAMGRRGLVETIVRALRERNFLYVHLDYFYLEGTEFYRRRHFRQSALVTGHDPASGRFSLACYLRNGLFGVTRVPCGLFADAFRSPLGRANSTPAARVDRLHRMRRPDAEPTAARLDPNAIKWQLADYLDGTNEAARRVANPVLRDWGARFDTSTPADTRYGLDVHEGVREALRSLAAGRVRRMDFRVSRLLWEHKRLMTIRLRRLAALGIAGDAGLVERWEEVEILARVFHFNLFRAISRGERPDLGGAEAGLRDIESRERAILAVVRADLEKY
jgi:phenylacetate-CoA ligase